MKKRHFGKRSKKVSLVGFSIITPTTGNSAKLLRLWNSLKSQELTAWEWIVVSAGPAPAFWPSDPRARWIQRGDLSVNAARNLGGAMARGRYLMFLDDDVILPSSTHLQKRLQAHQQNPSAVLGGGYHHSKECGFWDRAYNVMCHLWLKRFQLSNEGELLLGGNFSLEAALFQRHPLMASAPWGGEETLSFLQWKKNEVRLSWQRHLYVEHHPQKSAIEFFKTAWRQGRGKAMSQTQLTGKTRRALLIAAGWWLPVIGLYWLVVEMSRILTAPPSEKRAFEPVCGRPAGTSPAKSTSK